FSPNTVVGKTYDLTTVAGRALWERVAGGRALMRHATAETAPMYGEPTLFRPRLGQGAFRVVVTDAYQRHCAVTGEKTLPVLEAAHIRPVSAGGEHRVDNGLLLRSDLHTLFDRGYVTVTPRAHVEVSSRIREEFENGRDYYALHGREIRVPAKPELRPSAALLAWHNENVFLE